MMNRVFRMFVLAGITAFCLAAVDRGTNATTTPPIEMAQTAPTINQKVLEVALPESATVTLTSGDSFTGALTDFTPDDLTLAVGDFSQAFLLNDIEQVELSGTVWIVSEDGQRTATRIRGLAIPIEDIPMDALEVVSESNLARLNLETVLSDSEFDKLSSDPEKTHAITKILFEPTATMEVTIKAVRR